MLDPFMHPRTSDVDEGSSCPPSSDQSYEDQPSYHKPLEYAAPYQTGASRGLEDETL